MDTLSCIQRLQNGDQQAAKELFQCLYPLVLRLVRAHLPKRSSEEDLCQTVFMKIFLNIGQYVGKVPLEHWVSRVSINTCLNHIAAEKIRPELRLSDLSEEQEQVIEKLNSTSDDMDLSHQLASRELVELLLSRLAPKERLLITLLHLEECSVEEIHERTGWSRALIKVNAFRARQKLKKQLEILLAQEKYGNER